MLDNCEPSCTEIEFNTEIIEKIKCSMERELDVERLSEVFKIIGDPTRIKILYALSKYELCVCNIAETLGMTQSAISHQLRLLRNLKLVKYRKEGKSVMYSMDDEHIVQLFNQGMEHVNHS